jgi:GTP pyrophosphokinase
MNWPIWPVEAQRLFQLQRQASQLRDDPLQTKVQIENVRRMLLAFSRDLRVVMLLMASHLQSLRYTASLKVPGFEAIARESLQVFAPLANRLGVWQIKWEMEDLAFRMLEPAVYKEMAGLLELKRTEREQEIGQVQSYLQTQLKQQGIAAQVQGTAQKHLQHCEKDAWQIIGFRPSARLASPAHHRGECG